MRYERRYIQYNDLVFDDMDMLGEYDNTSVSYKMDTAEYSGGHGSYVPLKKSLYIKESSVSIKLTLHMKKLPCEKRAFYRDFAVEQLSEPGKLWAVQDNQIVWAYAYVSGYSESTVPIVDRVEMDIDFVLYEGVWHKANPYKTFLQPYDVCTYLNCFEFKNGNESCNCCVDCVDQEELNIKMEECCCSCDSVTKDMALCHHWNDLQSFYDKCTGHGYRIVYDCEMGEKFFGDEFLGQKMCNDCGGVIAGQLYSNTSIPTENFTIILNGVMHNPSIEINGNTNWIKGDYDGALMIHSNGDIVYRDGCCDKDLSPSLWRIPSGMDYGWTINPRNNRVVIDLGDCCGVKCAYFQIDALTI